ncbi:MAG: cation:proton antiporter [Candidatus Micrarchaeota archaeon]|nr:cation:proton antiporter [Candidatus Micrarchaeota archaeon]MBU1681557.1 cation:proton antiporter [Candidatus Micrarchaeota archaeon]
MNKLMNRIIPLFIIVVFIVLLFSVVRSSIFGHVNDEKHIYFEIVFLLLLAVGGELVVVHLKQPSVMILMVLGILVSPSFLDFGWEILHSIDLPITLPDATPNILRLEEIIHVFAQLGAVILLFKIGLHNKIEHMFSKENAVVAISGVVLPFAVGFLYASLNGGNFAYSMFLGAALTATSVGVTVAILKEFGVIRERFAKIIIGAALIDDVLGLLVLSFVINVASGTVSLVPLATIAITAIIFLSGSILIGKYIVGYIDRKGMSARRFLFVIAFMLLYSYIAEFVQLSAIVGAFIAGLVLNQSRHSKEINEKTYGLEILFMPIFFITLGMLIDIKAILEFALPIMIISILAILTKVISCTLAALWAKLNLNEALLVGVGMSPRGEVALIIAAIGLTTGILNPAQYSIISAMALITTFVAPPMLNHLMKKRIETASKDSVKVTGLEKTGATD